MLLNKFINNIDLKKPQNQNVLQSKYARDEMSVYRACDYFFFIENST